MAMATIIRRWRTTDQNTPQPSPGLPAPWSSLHNFAKTMPSREEEIEERLEWEERKDDTPMFYHMIAGSCAGVSEHLCMFPVDTYKVCGGLDTAATLPSGTLPQGCLPALFPSLALTPPPPRRRQPSSLFFFFFIIRRTARPPTPCPLAWPPLVF